MLWGASVQAVPGGPRTAITRDLVDTALRASGYTSTAARRRARALFEGHVGPVIADLGKVSKPRRQAELLLRALHRKGGLLGVYDPRATTLRDILERRTYNCVSASVLYNLIAHRLSLPVAAQLLPTHARSMLSLEDDGRLVTVVVETTSSDGFDPDPAQQSAILEAVTPTADQQRGRALVSARGAIVDTAVLIGTIYVNRASIAHEAGRLDRAEKLFRWAEETVPEPAMRRVLIDQRAALLAQLAADDMTTDDPRRYERALRSLQAAVRLSPASPDVASSVQHNLRAVGERLLSAHADGGDEEAILAAARRVAALMTDPPAQAGVEALAMSRVANIRIGRQDIDGAIRFLDRGLGLSLSPADEPLRRTLRANLVSALRMAALQKAKAGDYGKSQTYFSRLEALPFPEATNASIRAQIRADRVQVIQLVGQRRMDARDLEGAAAVYREGVQKFSDETSRHNLVVALERMALPLVERGECERAGDYIDEIRRLDPKAEFPTKARLRCLLLRARSRLDEGDFGEAVRLLRLAGTEREVVRQGLSAALLNWTAALARAARCEPARQRAAEASAVDITRPADVRAALGPCR